jgi:glycosyltransferase involved in cell wall biosynthesis
VASGLPTHSIPIPGYGRCGYKGLGQGRYEAENVAYDDAPPDGNFLKDQFEMKTAVHVTHEAVQKIGGIGAVLHGLLTSRHYSEHVDRDILVGPLFSTDGPAETRLGIGGEVLYSSMDGIVRHPLAAALQAVEQKYNVGLVYGRKTFYDKFTQVTSHPEVLLINLNHYSAERIAAFKWELYDKFRIESNRYEWIWDYEQYVRLAEPAIEALSAIGVGSPAHPAIIFAHEYMGMPTALAAKLNAPESFRTIFYAHEVAPMRRIVEAHPGYDISFYNAMRLGRQQNLTVDDVFGSQSFFYKYPLVDAARYCDNIFAVGDYIIDEFRFLNPAFQRRRIDLAYNGVPAFNISLDEKTASRRRLQHYCQTLLGFKPDYVFAHVTRMVLSKGLWRDIRVMEQIESRMAEKKLSAVLIVLSTETSARRTDDIISMEANYSWPVAHREGHPDLTGGEAAFYTGVQEFNARSRNCKVIYINQFGFDRRTCGMRMPADMDFMDIRQGSDVEFGQSVYEPFGIAQVEPISFGGLCVFTSLCGCAGFARKAAGPKGTPNVLEVDYTTGPHAQFNSIEACLAVDKNHRIQIERAVAAQVADKIMAGLPVGDAAIDKMLKEGYRLASQMSWEVVARDYVLPGMDRALAETHVERVRPQIVIA